MDEETFLIRSDEDYMRIAYRQAERAFEQGEVPIGAIVVHQGQVIAQAYNQVEMLKDATAHAEILAITQASAALGDWRMQECTLFVTKEPCAMCAGAMVNAKLGRLVFGLRDRRYGCAGGALDITGFEGMLHNVEVKSGVLEEQNKELIQAFFQAVRVQKKQQKKANQ